MEEYFKKRIRTNKKRLKEAFKLLKIQPIKIDGIEHAKTLLYEYIRDGYRALLDDGEPDDFQYGSLINIVEIAFEHTALDYIPKRDESSPVTAMSARCVQYFEYLHRYDKRNMFHFAEILGSVYLFLLDLKLDRINQKTRKTKERENDK